MRYDDYTVTQLFPTNTLDGGTPNRTEPNRDIKSGPFARSAD
jgi:hypothetical protein